MGKRRKFRKQNKQVQESNGIRGAGYSDIVRENKNFEQYYKLQKIVPEEEWDQFMATIRENLPSSFRITNFKGEARLLLDIFKKEYCQDLINIAEDKLEEPIALPWYPNEFAWQLNLSRTRIRKNEAYVKLHNFLMSETESGYINRQETVSMLPPILLDPQPHHKVLDMCAAPGSKTGQLIEALHVGDANLPGGVLVANDADNKRCYMLVHQAKRLQSPNFIITNHDATVMPNIRTSQGIIKYDRVLCDVPCGGDGTIRKNFDVWRKWNVSNSNYLHNLQVRVARRGLELLAVGGRLVYSTCSLNPVEDEAVIHHLLSEGKGSVRLIDVADKLPGLKAMPGLSSWVVMGNKKDVFSKHDDLPEGLKRRMSPGLFPPTPEDAPNFELHKCFRVLPHHQNTGGFFVALLEKVSTLPWEKGSNSETVADLEPSQSNSNQAEQSGDGQKMEEDLEDDASKDESNKEDDECGSPPAKKRNTGDRGEVMRGYKEDPFVFFTPEEDIWPSIRDYYGILPTFDPTLLMTRCHGGKKRNLYLVSQAIKEVVTSNVNKLKIINTGIKVFARSDNRDSTCSFRLTHEGISTILPFVTKRVVHINREDLINLLTVEIPSYSKISVETKTQLSKLNGGSVALVFNGKRPDGGEEVNISLVGWKGKTSVRSYIPKNEKIHFLRLVGADTSKYEHNKFVAEKDVKEDTETAEPLGENEAAQTEEEVKEEEPRGKEGEPVGEEVDAKKIEIDEMTAVS